MTLLFGSLQLPEKKHRNTRSIKRSLWYACRYSLADGNICRTPCPCSHLKVKTLQIHKNIKVKVCAHLFFDKRTDSLQHPLTTTQSKRLHFNRLFCLVLTSKLPLSTLKMRLRNDRAQSQDQECSLCQIDVH